MNLHSKLKKGYHKKFYLKTLNTENIITALSEN
jgi:hypothetical protein